MYRFSHWQVLILWKCLSVSVHRVCVTYLKKHKSRHHVSFLSMKLMPSVRAEISRYGGGNDEREQTLNQLLAEMDGFDSSKRLIYPCGSEQTGGA